MEFFNKIIEWFKPTKSGNFTGENAPETANLDKEQKIKIIVAVVLVLIAEFLIFRYGKSDTADTESVSDSVSVSESVSSSAA